MSVNGRPLAGAFVISPGPSATEGDAALVSRRFRTLHPQTTGPDGVAIMPRIAPGAPETAPGDRSYPFRRAQ